MRPIILKHWTSIPRTSSTRVARASFSLCNFGPKHSGKSSSHSLATLVWGWLKNEKMSQRCSWLETAEAKQDGNWQTSQCPAFIWACKEEWWRTSFCTGEWHSAPSRRPEGRAKESPSCSQHHHMGVSACADVARWLTLMERAYRWFSMTWFGSGSRAGSHCKN